MIRFLYNLLWPVGLLVLLPGYLRKMFRRGGYRRKFGQRFGFYGADVRQRLQSKPVIWVHAVSVGEVMIALKLIRVMLRLDPGTQIALTTTTTTGFAFAEKNASPETEVLYSPLDFWPVVHQAFSVIRPELLLLVEAEVWPNLMAETRQRRVPVALVNARLSPRSERRFTRFRRFVSPLFRQLDLICLPEEADVERWIALGAGRERLKLTGSVKFDPADAEHSATNGLDSANPPSMGEQPDRPVLFGGSTHPGEEEILARIYLQLRTDFPQLLLFVAPRHVERAKEVKKRMEMFSLGVSLCSDSRDVSAATADCLILDRTGELRQWYSIASVVFVGKSLSAIGGQNPVEPIVAGKPVIFGPHMENFAALARELVAHRGAIEVADEETLRSAIRTLLTEPDARRELVENARHIIDGHRGATERTVRLVLDLTKQEKVIR